MNYIKDMAITWDIRMEVECILLAAPFGEHFETMSCFSTLSGHIHLFSDFSLGPRIIEYFFL